MDILIVGLGEVGSHLAKVLSSEGEGHDVTVIDNSRQRLRQVTDHLDVKAVFGDGSRPDVLDRAGADSSYLLLAVSNDDNVNMLACLFGKRIGAKQTVLRVKDMTPFHRFRSFFRKNLMFDQILSLEDLAAEEIVKTLRQNQAVGVENFADGKVQMRRLKLSENSPLIDVPLKDIKFPPGVLITAIDRNHDVIVPGGEDTILANDEIFVLGEPKAIAAFEKKTGVRATYLKSVVMTGATSVVVQVCKALERLHVGSRVIVSSREDAESLATLLDNTLVLHGEGTDLELLKEEHVGDADAFLGLSEHDETNLMSCQLASSLGVKRTVALVHKPDYVSLYQQLGIDVSISPRLLCANRILSFVRSGSISTIATIEEGKAEVLELEVPAASRLVGKKLMDARFPRGCVVGAIAREGGKIVIPRGDDMIEALDNLVVFVLNEVVEKVLAMVGVRRT
ncbi:MAG: Trk system potassium transporter TrkA [Planctomycetes bacterium]|nr:Trk system potassium transporter TrkA [Planctomycetota bacterium]